MPVLEGPTGEPIERSGPPDGEQFARPRRRPWRGLRASRFGPPLTTGQQHVNTSLTQARVHSHEEAPATVPAADGGGRAPLVTIGLNCYKAERWIGECLDSLLAQTVQDFEIVVSDNASPDRTFEICQAYASRDPRLRVYRTDRNIGVAGNINRVFELARGEYFCWASANDYYAPQFLERCLRPMREDPTIDLVASQLATFESDRNAARADWRHFEEQEGSGADRVLALLERNRDGRFFRGVFRRRAILPFTPLSSRFGQDIMLVVSVAANGRLLMLQEDPYYFERSAPGTVTHKVPAHLRLQHYEPDNGLRAYVFHRCRNQFEIWRIVLRAAPPGQKGRAARGLLGLSYRWKTDLYYDLYDIAGLVRGHLRTLWSRR